jgi:PAS domain S-box-containing protein
MNANEDTKRFEDDASLAFLTESENRFRLLSDSVPIGIFQTDAQGQIIYTNPCLQAISGLTPEVSLSDVWIDLLHPEDKTRVMEAFQQFLQGVAPFYIEFRLMRAPDDLRWVLGQAAPLRHQTGEILGHVGTITDITLHKEAEQTLKHLNLQLENRVADRTSQLRQANFKLRLENTIRRYHTTERQRVEIALNEAKDQLKAVLDAVPGCVAWVSSDLKYLGVNHHMARLMQTPSEFFVGKPIGFSGQQTLELTTFMQNFFAASVDLNSHAVDELAVQLHGATRHYLVVGQKYLQGNAAVFVGIDITERKNAETEIRHSLMKAQEINELKSRFIAVVSHEFRTPLTTILTAGELLEHYSQQWPVEKTQSYLRQIQNSVNRMTELLEDVLVINAEEAGKLKINPVSLDIVFFCQSLLEELRLGSGRNHPLLFHSPLTYQLVTLDEKLLRLILSNLISNALKYSPPGNPVEIHLSAHQGHIQLTVQDRGIGIPPEDLQYLFDLFHRAHNVGTTPGTGLGLAIVKKAVDLHGGTVEVQSEVGMGTQFTVTLPFQPLTEEYRW